MQKTETDRGGAFHGSARPSWRTTLRYFLLQLPGWVLAVVLAFMLIHAFDLGVGIWIGVGLWIAKDIVLFPFVWRSYISESPPPGSDLIGARGVVHESLAPVGYVRVGGELWRARLQDAGHAMPPGTPVRVIGLHEGLTLLVVPQDRSTNS